MSMGGEEPPHETILNIKALFTRAFMLFGFDIAIRVRRFILALIAFSQAIAKSFYAFSELSGDLTDTSRAKEKQNNDQDNDPFGATW
jgi:hypothetical protein